MNIFKGTLNAHSLSPNQYGKPIKNKGLRCMRMTLSILLETDFFQIEEAVLATELAERTDGEIYSWKTSGNENWLIRGFSIVDVLGLVVLPKGLPDTIEMPDDDANTGDED